jgi:anti-sigma factor RsiW
MSDQTLMTCEQLEERLSDWLDNDIDAPTRAIVERHLADCTRCTGLVAELASIRREAAALPELVPSRDLWPGIEARIEAPVIAIEAPRTKQTRSGRSLGNPWWVGAAAAGLVAVTAGVTYYLTPKPGATETVAVAPTAVVPAPDSSAPEEVTEGPASFASTSESTSTSRETRPSGSSRAPAAPAAQTEYARDVAQLRAIVSQRRSELDSTTIAVLEKNLELIDRAIAESRAALERDPASEFLAEQLARAMTKKVAILRTVALLPARS